MGITDDNLDSGCRKFLIHSVDHGSLTSWINCLSLVLAFARCNWVFMLFADNRAAKPCGWPRTRMGYNLDRMDGCKSVSEEYYLWLDLAAACDWLVHVSSVQLALWLTSRLTTDPETSMDLCPTVQVLTNRPLLSILRLQVAWYKARAFHPCPYLADKPLYLPTPPSILRIQNIDNHG